jgi:hypothetical protein
MLGMLINKLPNFYYPHIHANAVDTVSFAVVVMVVECFD